jgi:hypothetical protein
MSIALSPRARSSRQLGPSAGIGTATHLTVVVLDQGGHLVAAQWEDGSSNGASISPTARLMARWPWGWGPGH